MENIAASLLAFAMLTALLIVARLVGHILGADGNLKARKRRGKKQRR